MPWLSIAPAFGAIPSHGVIYDGVNPDGYFEDSDGVWQHLLAFPRIGEKEGSCVRGAIFHADARAPTQLNVDYLDALVLDVDEFADGRVIQPVEIVSRLFGHRCIIWTTYNHQPSAPRYRVVLPLARSVPRRFFRSLWELVNHDLGNVVGHKQYNADRLGYLPRLPNPVAQSYYWWGINHGPLFDPWQRYGELHETPDRIIVDMTDDASVDRTDWVSDEEAINKARAYMRDAHSGVQPGARHHKLFEKSCQLWHDFYLNLDQVTTVLLEINQRFTHPKQPADVLREVEAGWAWTRGPSARPQQSGPGSKRRRPVVLTKTLLSAFADRMKRKRHDLGPALQRLCRDETIADSAHDVVPTMRSIMRVLAENYREADARQVQQVIASSMSTMRNAFSELPQSFNVEAMLQVFAARQEELRTAERHRAEEHAHALAEQIKLAIPGRLDPYTLDEFSEYARQQQCTHEDLKHRLIVSFGPSYFFFAAGDYSVGHEHNADVVARTYLSLSQPFGVTCYKPPKAEGGEPKPFTMTELMDQYGVAADHMTVSLYESRSRYDHQNKKLILARTPIRAKPSRSPEVEDYLATFENEDLLDWLAYCPNLDRPLRLLYLWGAKDRGKSFIPKCLSRLWSVTGPSDGNTLLGNFNETVTNCPLVFMDEALPEGFRGKHGTSKLRHEIQETVRPMTGKFKKNATFTGALRFIFSANSPHHIQTTDTLTREDADAVAERLLVVHVPEAAGHFLRQIGFERTERWLTDDLFAKHVLWLRENREIRNLGRFGPIPREDNFETQRVALSLRFSGDVGRVLDFIYRVHVQGIQMGDAVAAVVDQAGAYHLALVPDQMRTMWSMIDLSTRESAPRELMRAIEAVSTHRGELRTEHEACACFVLDRTLLDAWMALNDKDSKLFYSKAAERFRRPRTVRLTQRVEEVRA